MKISKIQAREIYDSRGMPTLECELTLETGLTVLSSVPAGLSKGIYEATELRDGDGRLFGKGVLRAIENINTLIAPALINQVPDVVEMDLKLLELDNTANKSHLGANTLLAVSIAVAKAQAVVEQLALYELIALLCGYNYVTLPLPLFNVLNGGLHAPNSIPIQECMIIPVSAQNFRASMEAGVTVFYELKSILARHHKETAVGDEGGFAAHFASVEECLDLLMMALERAKEHGIECVIALDVAASQLYRPDEQRYEVGNKMLSSHELIAWYESLSQQYPIYSIEDGLSEVDWQGWNAMMQQLGDRVQIVGDDIFATHPERIAQGIERQVANGAIIKPNQIGTVSETLQVIQLCKNNNINTIISHRSGETEDTFIVDLAVGTSAGQIKAGSCCRGERIAKYNQLLRIEDVLTASLLNGG